ncbi:uncharacterized protein GGS22DRAFT_177432 [Annulohypoxylon maeteangense]|uniref:uncharacterized protein n=1 Tax=Annulohypoxylon maeteangense TaxID=1927788 RepID=UPI002007B76B|nr:uncharacterized protein GGS22DRAFT_177432 [Annulohypoxylon maeteangense]KAI0890755.1 hypothetical protein GGS22DRAFT_177432 [Annulohypoxylon maeteangense]
MDIFLFGLPAFLSLLAAITWIWTLYTKASNAKTVTVSPKKNSQGLQSNPNIKPLAAFNWETTEPQKFRPFKPIYYITMALRSTTPSELIIIDQNYQSRLRDRQVVMEKHKNHTLGCMPYGVEAVQEVYTYLLGEYLPTRYPTLFTRDEKSFRNSVTGATLPLLPPEDPITALRSLGQTVEDDMFFLRETPEGHQCIAFVCCCPSGFDPAAKIGKLLVDIHQPVPSYEKIGPSMERYFSRLEVGKGASRVNWSVTTNSELFNISTNHVHEGDKVEENMDIDIEKAWVRMELQTLTRMPKTRAILFSFKTYLYPVKDMKAEGLGPELADAIEGLKSGNAPGMWIYKGGVRWGKSVCEYLRS